MQFIVRKHKRVVEAALLMAFMLLLMLPVSAQDSGAFASVRLYDGIAPADQVEIGRVVNEGFLPIMREAPGFIGYYLVHDEDVLAAVSLFETQEQASASNELARDFVAESLAPLLPNSPQIIEGTVNLELVTGMDADDDDFSAMFASLRIYDDYNMANLDETTARARAGFLPSLGQTPGFFSYYALSNGVDTVAVINAFSSEEAALASNDTAAAFVAEHLAEFDMGTPTRISGSVSVAALAERQGGANLIDSDMDMDMQADSPSPFISIRRYTGIEDVDAAVDPANGSLLPIVREAPGFIGYYLLPTDADVLLAVNLFETREQALASNELASDFVASLPPVIPNPPRIVEGTVDVSFVEMPADDDDISALFASVRIYDGFDMANLDEVVSAAQDGFLPLLRQSPGFFGYYVMNDGIDVVTTISIFASEEAALASNEMARDFVAENLADFLPNSPLTTSGNLMIAALMAWQDGANLVDSAIE